MRTIILLLLLPTFAGASDSVLLHFHRVGCGRCAHTRPIITQLEREGIPVRYVDVERESHLVRRHAVLSVPTSVVLRGGRETARYGEGQSLVALRTALGKSQQLHNTGAIQQASSTPQLVPVQHNNAQLPSSSPTHEAMPSIDLATAIERALAATVRIRVKEHGAVGIATGTVIDTHGSEALILTCGHVFRETKGKTPIEVEVFHQGKVHKFPGQLIDYDAQTRDVGLVSISPGFSIASVPVLPKHEALKSGSPAFSLGCDRGADPSRRDTRITAINKYNQHVGASNIEISGAPTIGRSGGGLFDHQGRLIGVCNAADFEDNIGIYAGPGSVQWQLDRVELSHLYRPQPPAPAAPTQLALNSATPAMAPPPQPQQPVHDSSQEVIVIVRDRSRPQASPQVHTFETPPAELMQLLRRR